MKRILLINDSASRIGGAEIQFWLEVDLLRKRGYDVFTFTTGSEKINNSSKDIYFRESKSSIQKKICKILFNPSLYYSLKDCIRKINPDLIHIHKNAKYPLSILMACKGRKVLQTVHDYSFFCPTGWSVYKKNLRVCYNHLKIDCFLRGCVNPFSFIFYYFPTLLLYKLLSKRIIKRFITPSDKLKEFMRMNGFKNTVCVNNPIDVYKWKYHFADSRIILFVGTLKIIKGEHSLIRAFSVISKKFKDVKLIIIGDGFEKRNLIWLSRRLGVSDKVIFTGNIPNSEIIEYHKKAGLFVLPSVWMDNFPVVLCEAMAAGTPVIGSDRGGIPELVQEGETGVLFKAADYKDLAEKMGTVLKDKKLRKNISLNARKFVENNLSSEAYYNKLINLIEDVWKR